MKIINISLITIIALCAPVASAQTNTNDTGLTSIDTSPSPELERGPNADPNQPVNYQSDNVKDPLRPQPSRVNLQTSGTRTSGTLYTGVDKNKAGLANRSAGSPRPPVVGTPIPETTPGTRGGSGTSGAGTGIGSVNTTTKSDLDKSDGSTNTSR